MSNNLPFGTLGGHVAVSTGEDTCGACDCKENCIERNVQTCKVRGLEILGTYSMEWNKPMFGTIETDGNSKPVYGMAVQHE